jgi:hypothetical protein
MSASTPAIQLENLTYAYGRAEAVRDLNLTEAAVAMDLRTQRRRQDNDNNVAQSSRPRAARSVYLVWIPAMMRSP